MKISPIAIAFLITTGAAATIGGCKEQAEQSESVPTADPTELSIAQVSELLDSAQPPKVFDANGAETRAEYGVLPGATLLDSPNAVQGALPADKETKLVFYCGSTRCQAAEGAARKALAAGYRDVNVMPAGIRGWKEAGKATQPVKSAGS